MYQFKVKRPRHEIIEMVERLRREDHLFKRVTVSMRKGSYPTATIKAEPIAGKERDAEVSIVGELSDVSALDEFEDTMGI